MDIDTFFLFPPFWLDVRNEQLWRGAQTLALRPKTFAVLRYLIAQAGQLITQDELLDAVWGQTAVSEAEPHAAPGWRVWAGHRAPQSLCGTRA